MFVSPKLKFLAVVWRIGGQMAVQARQHKQTAADDATAGLADREGRSLKDGVGIVGFRN